MTEMSLNEENPLYGGYTRFELELEVIRTHSFYFINLLNIISYINYTIITSF